MEDLTLLHLIRRLRHELGILEAVLGDVETAASIASGSHTAEGALVDQYLQPPSDMPAEERTRAPGAISRPTESITLDDRRRQLRNAVLVCGPVLAGALVRVIGTRRALELAHGRWKGVAHPADPE